MNIKEKQDWFYEHDNEWQNDMEIEWQESQSSLSLIEWAWNKYH